MQKERTVVVEMVVVKMVVEVVRMVRIESD
jgi:hypothetical protein